MANEIFPVTYYQTCQKLQKFCQKLQKFVMLKYLKHSTTTGNYAVNYYKSLEEAPWHLGLKKFRK